MAAHLIESNYDVTIIDKANDFFTGSSSKNQNRLHLGFHYPRSIETIQECKWGYEQFVKLYGFASAPIDENVYFVANDSKTTVPTMLETFRACDIPFQSHETCEIARTLDIRSVADVNLVVGERYIDNNRARDHFKSLLRDRFAYVPPERCSSVRQIKEYMNMGDDCFVVNCTYNHLNPIGNCSYELFLSLLYKSDVPGTFAVTVMDGPFFSIFPYDVEERLYTVTSVEHGVVYSGTKIIEMTIDDETLADKKRKIEALLDEFSGNWRSHLAYFDFYLSWKTKPETTTDDRSVRFAMDDGDVLSIYGGKITGIFSATQSVDDAMQRRRSESSVIHSGAYSP